MAHKVQNKNILQMQDTISGQDEQIGNIFNILSLCFLFNNTFSKRKKKTHLQVAYHTRCAFFLFKRYSNEATKSQRCRNEPKRTSQMTTARLDDVTMIYDNDISLCQRCRSVKTQGRDDDDTLTYRCEENVNFSQCSELFSVFSVYV